MSLIFKYDAVAQRAGFDERHYVSDCLKFTV